MGKQKSMKAEFVAGRLADFVMVGDVALPVTTYFDGLGDECDREDGESVVAGTDCHDGPGGFWVAMDVDKTTVH
jgi:hypothetical protein